MLQLPGSEVWGRAADFGEEPFEAFYGWCFDSGFTGLFDGSLEDAPLNVYLDYLKRATTAFAAS